MECGGLQKVSVEERGGLPLVSFVLIAYNQEAFIREAIEGAFAQTYGNLEIVLSDDHSPDSTFEIMKKMATEYVGPHRIILNRNMQNRGIGPHFEHAVSLSNGRWIVPAAGDDISVPERVEKSMDVIREHGELGGVFGRFHAFTDQFKDVGDWFPPDAANGRVYRGRNAEWIDNSTRGKLLGTPGCSAMWNRKLFELFSPMPEGVIAEDLVLGCRALISGLGIGYTSAGIVHYRNHNSNTFSGVKKEIFERRVFFSRAVVHRDLLEFLKKYPDTYSSSTWERIVRYFETNLFRSIVTVRRDALGRFWSRILFLVGFGKSKVVGEE